MGKYALLLGLAIIFLLPFSNHAQSDVTHRERRADKHVKNESYYKAISLYEKVIKRKPTNGRVKLKLARTYFQANHKKQAETHYSEVIHKKYLVKSKDYLRYAQALQSTGNATKAEKWARKYLEINPRSEIAQSLVYSLENIDQYYQDSSRYLVKELAINTEAEEFSPAYFQSGFVFVSSRSSKYNLKRKYSRDNSKFLNLYYTEALLGDELLTNPVKLKGEIGSRFHQGPAAFFDNENSIIFTSNNITSDKKTDGILQLYVATNAKPQNKWVNVEPVPFNHHKYSSGHPAFNNDQTVLYFVSDRPGGYGGADLYKVSYADNKWGKPENLGAEINSQGDEMFPFVDNNNRLYFASNGRGGLGGYDIFYTDLNLATGEIRNMGFPINSTSDDFGLIYQESKKLGYFSSDRSGQSDLFQFNETSYDLQVLVRDNNMIPIPQCQVSLKSNGFTLLTTLADGNGGCKFSVSAGQKYELVAEKAEYSATFSSVEVPAEDTTLEITMDPLKPDPQIGTLLVIAGGEGSRSYVLTDNEVIEVKEQDSPTNPENWLVDLLEASNINIERTVEINPVLYDFDKSSIRDEYLKELDKLANLMKQYDFIQFELAAHTDAIGPIAYNQTLSEKRADSVFEYLTSNQIKSERLLAKGYGESRPIAECEDRSPCSNYLRSMNRRTEFRLIYMDENQVVSNY